MSVKITGTHTDDTSRYFIVKMRTLAAISNFSALCTAAYCLCKNPIEKPEAITFVQAAYIILLWHGLTNLLDKLVDDNRTIFRTADFAAFLRTTVFLPLCTTQIWLLHAFIGPEAAYAHTGLGAFVVIMRLVKDGSTYDMVDALNVVCIISHAAVSFKFQNYNSLGAVACYTIGYSLYRDSRRFADVDGTDWYNFLCCGTALCMLIVTTGSIE